MNKTLGGYHNDERSHYTFNFSDNNGKHVTVSFGAEPEYDLDIIFQEFRNFLVATNHDVEGQIGELNNDEDDYDNPMEQSWEDASDEVHAMTQYQAADKFTMDHFPNNGWPFGSLTTSALPAMTSVDLSGIKPFDLSSINQFPTMAPLTSQQVQSWSLSSEQIKALTNADISKWRVDAPGTIGGAKVTF
jgi:hypothetical protein